MFHGFSEFLLEIFEIMCRNVFNSIPF
jgi:hypothetical protein